MSEATRRSPPAREAAPGQALVGLATAAAALAGAGDAQAAVVTTTFELGRIPASGPFDPMGIDLDGDRIADFELGYGALGHGSLGYGILGYSGRLPEVSLGYGGLGYGGLGYGELGYGGLGDLGYGDLGYGVMISNADILATAARQNQVVVDAAAPYLAQALGADEMIGVGRNHGALAMITVAPVPGGPAGLSPWSRAFVGFQFQSTLSGTLLHGFFNVEQDGEGFTLLSATYDDTGAPIRTPAPEPHTLALLALGAAGLGALRRRRGAGDR